MIKLVTVLKRRATMARQEFGDRWLNVHAPIAARFPGLRGYVLSFSVAKGEPSADGVAQLWFDDRASAQAAYSSDIGRNGSNDARRNLSRRDHLLVSERWIGEPEACTGHVYKLMVGVKRLEGHDRATFLGAVDDLAAGNLLDGLSARAVRVCLDEMGQQLNSGVDGNLTLFKGEAIFDAALEAWYPDAASLRDAETAFPQSEAGRRLAGLSKFTELFILSENVVLAPPESVQPAKLLASVSS